jgi:predicted Zn-dependent peptidase
VRPIGVMGGLRGAVVLGLFLAAGFSPAPTFAFVPAQRGRLERVVLENGLVVLSRPVRDAGALAVEMIYAAGLLDNPKGQVFGTDLLQALAAESLPSDSELSASWQALRDGRMTSSVSTGLDTQFGCVVDDAQLETVLRIEARRLEGLSFTTEALQREVALQLATLEDPGLRRPGRDLRLALAALSQGWRHEQQEALLHEVARPPDTALFEELARRIYRPERATLVLVGSFDPSAALLLVREHLGVVKLPQPGPSVDPAADTASGASSGTQADAVDWLAVPRRSTLRWDGPFDAVCIASPPPAGRTEKLMLSLWGTELLRRLRSNADLREKSAAIHCNGPAWSSDSFPPFVLAVAAEGVDVLELEQALTAALAAALVEPPTEVEMLQWKSRAARLARVSELLTPDALAADRLRQESLGHTTEQAMRVVLGRVASQLASTDRLLGVQPEETLRRLSEYSPAAFHGLVRDQFSERQRIVTLLEVFDAGEDSDLFDRSER